MRLGLFRALAEAPRRPAELAAGLGLHEPYVRAFCETGFHLEVLDREGDAYRMAPEMDRLLARAGIPAMRGSWTMKMGASEKVAIRRTSSASLSGDRNAGRCRPQMRR